jgi:integrase
VEPGASRRRVAECPGRRSARNLAPACSAALQVAVDSDPTFHTFASEWLNAHRGEWAPNTLLDYKWQLRNHLLPFFAGHRLSQITIVEVDRYRQAKVEETSLSAESINKTITRLGQILEVASSTS